MTPHADHPLRDDIDLVREMLLAAAPGVVEGIKWSAPSFRLADDFATFHLRSTEEVALILHTGAKKRVLTVPMDLNDPEGLIERLAPDRCMVRLGAGKDAAGPATGPGGHPASSGSGASGPTGWPEGCFLGRFRPIDLWT
jgi:hypothetical protein